MAQDISNKTLALLVGLSIMVSLVGIFSVQQGGITGAQVTNVTPQTEPTNSSLAMVVSINDEDISSNVVKELSKYQMEVIQT